MFGIGLSEILIILVICLFLFDIDKLPKIARSLGKAIKEFRKAQRSLTGDDEKFAG